MEGAAGRVQRAVEACVPPKEWWHGRVVAMDAGACDAMPTPQALLQALRAGCLGVYDVGDVRMESLVRKRDVLLLWTGYLDQLVGRVRRWLTHGANHVRVLCARSEDAHAASSRSSFDEDAYEAFRSHVDAWCDAFDDVELPDVRVDVVHWPMYVCATSLCASASFHLPLHVVHGAPDEPLDLPKRTWKRSLRHAIRRTAAKQDAMDVEKAHVVVSPRAPSDSTSHADVDVAKETAIALMDAVMQLGGRMASTVARGRRSRHVAHAMAALPSAPIRKDAPKTTLVLVDRSTDLLAALRRDPWRERAREATCDVRWQQAGMPTMRQTCKWKVEVDEKEKKRWKKQANEDKIAMACASGGDATSALKRAVDALHGEEEALVDACARVGLAYACAGAYLDRQLEMGASPFDLEEEGMLRRAMRARLMRHPEESAREPWLMDVVDVSKAEVGKRNAAMDNRVEEVLDKLRKVAYTARQEAQGPNPHQTAVAATVEEFLDGKDVPGFTHVPTSLGALMRTGLGALGLKQSHPSQNPLVVVFVLGGITHGEMREVLEVAKKHGREVVVGGSHEIEPMDAFRGIMAGSPGYQ